MKIEVKNFGPIKKGTIDLDKRFTVFVGYNNSGKTYMSQLLWGLHNNPIRTNIKNSAENNAYVLDHLDNTYSKTIAPDEISLIIDEYKSYLKDAVFPDLFNVKTQYFSQDKMSIEFLGDLLSEFTKIKFSYFAFNISNGKEGLFPEYYIIKKNENSLEIHIEKMQLDRPKSVFDVVGKDNRRYAYYFGATEITDIIKHITGSVTFMSLFDAGNKSFFLPATRTFFPSYYKYIYSVAKDEKDLIDSKLKNGGGLESIKSLSKSTYTKATDDLIENIYRLNTNPEVKNHFGDLLQELKAIIGGDIIIKSAEGIAPIEFFLKLDNGKELDMYLSSSSANQLTTLYLYFKFWAEEKNNYLIIDEPEENLHPENQIKLVNLLMKFADRGNKVLITTHSPLITDHVNNYANLSHLAETGMDMKSLIAENKLEMVAVETIKKDDYGVYFFNGDSIKEYTVDDYGVYFKDFADAEDKVKETSNILKEKIYYNIHSDARKPLQE